ncbi:MAG: thioredoxin domain-containing protein [Actinomycetota bacterium]
MATSDEDNHQGPLGVKEIRFPGHAVGRLYVGSRFVPAQGVVTIPEDDSVRLILSRRARPEDLRLLGPTDLHGLTVDSHKQGDRLLEVISALRGLRSLVMTNCAVSSLGLRHLEGLPELSQLNLFKARLDDLSLPYLSLLTSLRRLSLGNNRVSDGGLESLGSLQLVEMLDLSGTSVLGDGLVHLSCLPRLAELHLSGTPVGDDALCVLAGFPALSTLVVSSTGITATGLLGFRPAGRVQVVGVKMTSEEADALRATRPELVLNGISRGRAGVDVARKVGSSSMVDMVDAEDIEVDRGSRALLLDFWAPWCKPCTVQDRALHEARESLGVDVLRVNVEEFGEVAGRFQVSALPTLILIHGGSELLRLVGSRSAAEVTAEVSRYL